VGTFLQHNSVTLTVWLGAVCTLAIFSILYRENAFYRLFEHIFIGLAAGQGIFITISEVLYPRWWHRMINEGHWYWIFAFVAGAMFYFVYSKRHVWISRIIFGAFMGFGAGLAFKDFVNQYVPQMVASFKPLRGSGLSFWDIANNLVFLIVFLTAMSYFFFSIEHKYKSVRAMSGAGRWLLMFAFGAIFGATVGARMSLLIGRIDFLKTDWLQHAVWPLLHH
jgi:hypothetical protein